MKIDTLALVVVALVAGLWFLAMLFGAVAAGPAGFLLLIPMLVVAYFVGTVISQRLRNTEDDYYDKVEK